jgi:hypothetical protein
MTKIKDFEKKGPNSKIKESRSWYPMKGLTRRNTYVKYESSTTSQSKVMTKVKVFEKKVKLHGQGSEDQGHGISDVKSVGNHNRLISSIG